MATEPTQDEQPSYQIPIVSPSDRRGATSIIAPIAEPRVSPVGKMLWVSVVIVAIVFFLLTYR